MKRRLFELLAVAALTGAGVFLVVALGIVPIRASSGHWPPTRWFLNFAKERSVATQTAGGAELTGLDDPALVAKGAGHYYGGCLPCHASPQRSSFARVTQGMTPPPPYLPDEVSEWEADELFYIVKHGIKFTGMPAFPSQQRDDEVRAVVAFLLALPTLSQEAFDRLVGASPELPQEVQPLDPALRELVERCARCHGSRGAGRGHAAFPKLAGQRPAYIAGALRAYASGRRHSGIMQPVAAALGDGDVDRLAEYYGKLPAISVTQERRDPDAIVRGEAIAMQGITGQRVPICQQCHGPGEAPRRPDYPEIRGQYAGYLVLQLELFERQQRGGSPYASLMHPPASRLTASQMRDVAAYYASLEPE